MDLQNTPCPIKVNTKVIYAIDECAVENDGWKLQLEIIKNLIELYGVFESAVYSYGLSYADPESQKLIGFDYHADWVDVGRVPRATAAKLKVPDILTKIQILKDLSFGHGDRCYQSHIPRLTELLKEAL